MDTFKYLKPKSNITNNSQGIVIPKASGKGGVGKSFISANLAIAPAELGHRVITVDLDFGGANLHSFLGLSNRHPGVGDFLKDRAVLSSIRKRHPFLPNYRASLAAENIVRIAQRVEKFWNQPVKDSAALLFNHVKKDFENRQRTPFVI